MKECLMKCVDVAGKRRSRYFYVIDTNFITPIYKYCITVYLSVYIILFRVYIRRPRYFYTSNICIYFINLQKICFISTIVKGDFVCYYIIW